MSDEESPKKKPGDYEVGYGKPPKHTQFKKNQSGKPSGRPKGSRNVNATVKRIFGRKIPVRIDGKEQYLTAVELSAETIVEKVRKKDFNAATRSLAIVQGIEKAEETKAASGPMLDHALEPFSEEDEAIALEYFLRQKALREAF